MARGPYILSFNADGAANTAAAQSAAMSSTNTFYSKPVNVRTFGKYQFTFKWASGSSPVGTLTFEYTTDGTTWVDSGVAGLAVSGNSGAHIWERESFGEVEARIKYVNASGTATATGTFAGQSEAS